MAGGETTVTLDPERRSWWPVAGIGAGLCQRATWQVVLLTGLFWLAVQTAATSLPIAGAFYQLANPLMPVLPQKRWLVMTAIVPQEHNQLLHVGATGTIWPIWC